MPSVTQNDIGGNVAGIADQWIKWAHVEDRSGFNSNTYQQQVWQYDYKITQRYERTRPTKSNYEVIYEGWRLKIESISIDEEGYKGFEVLRCSKVDEFIEES